MKLNTLLCLRSNEALKNKKILFKFVFNQKSFSAILCNDITDCLLICLVMYFFEGAISCNVIIACLNEHSHLFLQQIKLQPLLKILRSLKSAKTWNIQSATRKNLFFSCDWIHPRQSFPTNQMPKYSFSIPILTT